MQLSWPVIFFVSFTYSIIVGIATFWYFVVKQSKRADDAFARLSPSERAVRMSQPGVVCTTGKTLGFGMI
tara:strand:+ start:841 stop:1050 length:210 start_codon:yes stop_codon:yes gene_type:complete